ncbi:MAG: DUF2460 domain-containing protein [Pacificimonas sp.]|jgi:uncharacterized protein (TIGR02217 family)|nr:DUF2460 domain-containing protein [Pacificimonas sp.]
MPAYLAGPADSVRQDWVKRFEPSLWTVNFPRPMMAALTVPTPGSLRLDFVSYKANDLAGIIWESEDTRSHPLLAYETKRDYRDLILRFRIRLEGSVRSLPAVNGPVLTIEGRDESGAARVWYVRLWNYAEGIATDAEVTLDFDALDGGFSLPGDGDPVWAGDIDRMFISAVSNGYTGQDVISDVTYEGTIHLEDIRVEGRDAAIRRGDACVPPHGLRMATGYDDQYNLTPTRVLATMRALGYRERLTLYVGMSHFMRLKAAPLEQRLVVDEADDPLCGPARAWFTDLAAKAAVDGITVTWSLSYELFNDYCPGAWKQRAHDGSPALTGWVPPSTLLSPANTDAMDWLQRTAGALVSIGAAVSGDPPSFQVGEPWWWTGFGDGRVPCLYDDEAVALADGADIGAQMTDLPGALSAEQEGYVDLLGGVLGQSVLDLRDAALAVDAGCETALLFYAPQVLDDEAPWLTRLNMPAAFAAPAFDMLQLEDYDFVIEGRWGDHRRAVAAVEGELGYPAGAQHYFSGFVLNAADAHIWVNISEALDESAARGVADRTVWALPQVMRDGWTYFEQAGDEAVQAFHDVSFPLALSHGAGGGPEFSTAVVETVSGAERRTSSWAQGRLRYDAGLGVRSEGDLAEIVRFFRARKGRAHGFRFRDPLDHASGAGGEVSAFDQVLGEGGGARTDFPLVKRYGDGDEAEVRRITRPETDSVTVAVDGTVVGGWSLVVPGVVRFDSALPSGLVTAGFRFDVPVRFAEDELPVSLSAFRAGDVPSVPLVEVRED